MRQLTVTTVYKTSSVVTVSLTLGLAAFICVYLGSGGRSSTGRLEFMSIRACVPLRVRVFEMVEGVLWIWDPGRRES